MIHDDNGFSLNIIFLISKNCFKGWKVLTSQNNLHPISMLENIVGIARKKSLIWHHIKIWQTCANWMMTWLDEYMNAIL